MLERYRIKIKLKYYLKELLIRFYQAILLFNRRRGTTLAASSTFYVILTIVPLCLLLIRLGGLFLGDIEKVHHAVFSLGESAFPDVAPEILLKVKELIRGPLFGEAKFTIINFFILSVSSLSFFNAIWSGLFLISGDKGHVSLWKHFKGMALIGMTVLIMVIAFSIRPIILIIVNLLKFNFLTEYLISFDSLGPVILFFRGLDLSGDYLFGSTIVPFIGFWAYFSFVYRWFFSWKIGFTEAGLSSGTFVGLLLLGKNLFWVYFLYVREGLIESYGDFYTIIIGLVWIFTVMCFFFFGACLCVIFGKYPWPPSKVE